LPIGRVIDDLLLLTAYSLDGEWEGQVRYLPLRRPRADWPIAKLEHTW
jgi:hypothetical protein